MGLTIHYHLKSEASDAEVRQLMTRLRSRALDLPFKEVQEIVQLDGKDCQWQDREQDDPLRWLLIQAGEYVDQPHQDGGKIRYGVNPTHVIAFETWPGDAAGYRQAGHGQDQECRGVRPCYRATDLHSDRFAARAVRHRRVSVPTQSGGQRPRQRQESDRLHGDHAAQVGLGCLRGPVVFVLR